MLVHSRQMATRDSVESTDIALPNKTTGQAISVDLRPVDHSCKYVILTIHRLVELLRAYQPVGRRGTRCKDTLIALLLPIEFDGSNPDEHASHCGFALRS